MSEQITAYQVDTVGADALVDFFESFSHAHDKIEQTLMLLELDAKDDRLITELIEAVQNIQKALHTIDFDELEKLINSLLELLNAIEQHSLEFETIISDIILLAVDDVKTVLEKIIDGSTRCVLLGRMPKVCSALAQIITTDAQHREGAIKDALILLDPSTEILEQPVATNSYLANLFDETGPTDEELDIYGVAETEDFIFFRALAEPLETRAKYWLGRADRMLRLALKMNDYADRPVEPNQLAAAVYMHDVGMALLPLSILKSTGELTAEDEEQIEKHPQIGYELLRYMKDWSEAAQIVLQHHERMDGSGYPLGLKENEICDGAKIIAIVDAMDARTHERAHAMLLKRPLLRAAMEISKKSDAQFSSYWVSVFRDVFHQMRKSTRLDAGNDE